MFKIIGAIVVFGGIALGVGSMAGWFNIEAPSVEITEQAKDQARAKTSEIIKDLQDKLDAKK